MPEPDERLAPAPPEALPKSEGLPAGWRAFAPDLTPLRRHRDFRLHTAGHGISFFGPMVTYVAVPYQVFELTGSSLAVGLLGVVEMVALLSLAFLGGALAAAADRRRLVDPEELTAAAALGALIHTRRHDRRTGLRRGAAGRPRARGRLRHRRRQLPGVPGRGAMFFVMAVVLTAAKLPKFWAYDDRIGHETPSEPVP